MDKTPTAISGGGGHIGHALTCGNVPRQTNLQIGSRISLDGRSFRRLSNEEPVGKNSYLNWTSAAKRIPGVLATVAIVSCLTNFLFYLHFRTYVVPDTISYVVPAKNLIAGRGFTNAYGQPELFRTPGYTVLMSPFLMAGDGLKYLVVVQHILAILIAVGTALFVFRNSGSRLQSLVAGVVLAVDLPFITAANNLLSELPFTAMLTVALYLVWSGSQEPTQLRAILLAGLLSGASVLVRPVAVLIFLPISLYLLLSCKQAKLKAAVAFTVAWAILPGLWMIRNHHVTDHYVLTTLSSHNLLLYRAAGVEVAHDPGNIGDNVVRRQVEMKKEECQALGFGYVEECPQADPILRYQYEQKTAVPIILHHIPEYLKLTTRSAAAMMLGAGPSEVAEITHVPPLRAPIVILAVTVPFFLFAGLGLAYWWRNDRRFFYLTFLVIAYFVLVSAGDAYSRMRVPIMPLYAALIGAGVALVYQKITWRRPPSQESADGA